MLYVYTRPAADEGATECDNVGRVWTPPKGKSIGYTLGVQDITASLKKLSCCPTVSKNRKVTAGTPSSSFVAYLTCTRRRRRLKVLRGLNEYTFIESVMLFFARYSLTRNGREFYVLKFTRTSAGTPLLYTCAVYNTACTHGMTGMMPAISMHASLH